MVFDPSQRKPDREIFEQVIGYLRAGRAVIFQDKYEISDFTDTVIRYVVFNGKENLVI